MLGKRHPHRGIRHGVGGALGDVADDADDREPFTLRARVVERDALAECITGREEFAGKMLVDDGDQRRVEVVALVEEAALQERDLQCRESIRSGDPVQRLGPFLFGLWLRRALVQKLVAVTVVGHGQIADKARRLDTGQRAQAVAHAREKIQRDPFEQIFILLLQHRWRQTSAERQHVRGIHPGVGLLELYEAARRQAADDEQHERERQLQHDEAAAHPVGLARPSAAARAVLQLVREVGPGNVQRGKQAKDEARAHGGGDDERGHAPVGVEAQPVGYLGNEAEHEVEFPKRQHEAREPAENAEQQALREHLQDDPAAAGAESKPYRNLPMARGAAREQEVGDIGAGDKQQGDHGPEHEVEAAADIAGGEVARHQRAETQAGVGRRMRRGEPRGDRVELCLDLLECDAGLDSRVDDPAVFAAAPFLGLFGDGERLPEVVRFGETEILRHHADHGRGVVVERDRLPEHVGAAAERFLPQRVAEDDDRRGAGLVLFGLERAAEHGLHAKRPETIDRDPSAEHAFRAVAAVEDVGAVPSRERAGQRRRRVAHIAEIRQRKLEVVARILGVDDAQVEQRGLVGEERQRPQQHGVEDREHRRRRGDADRERDDGDERKAGRFRELAEGKFEIGEHRQGILIRPAARPSGPRGWHGARG